MSRHPETAAVRCGIDSDPAHGAVAPALYLSANFSFAGFEQKRRYDYTRSGNPTRDEFAAALDELEGGAGCVVTATGLAAITLVLQRLAPGDLLVLPHDGYGGTWRLVSALARKGHFELAFVDQRDDAALGAVLQRRPALVWAETPSNPLLRLVDLERLAARCRASGALLVVDNTFCSPVLQNPLALGADLVVHSTTKYVNGHSDVVGGAVIARDAALAEELGWWANALGLTGAPFDSWLALRGLRTLAVRMRQHQDNAQAIAEWLAARPEVARVYYPGLATHADHALARRQQRGFGGMLSFELREARAVRPFVEALRCFTLAESLGGVESLIAHPATMTHASMSAEARATAGIGDRLLRLSVGIEHPDDLLADLDHALVASRAMAARADVRGAARCGGPC
ncbi:MAG: cystathionine gamma-synthase [Planctomycetes bacterium]|nr:cystathionine gamma-synthase [Planctomycetota bacterium]